MESEYIACSTACCNILPLVNLVQEVAKSLNLPAKDTTNIHSTIWEDNISCLTLAHLELPQMTPRSKRIAVKYHLFREQVASGKFSVHKVDTLD